MAQEAYSRTAETLEARENEEQASHNRSPKSPADEPAQGTLDGKRLSADGKRLSSDGKRLSADGSGPRSSAEGIANLQ